MVLRRFHRLSVFALVVLGLEASACDKLAKKDEAAADTSDSDDAKSKKKKKKKDDEENADATATASATASAAPTASATATATAEASAAPPPSASAAMPPTSTGEAKRYPDETPLPDKKRTVKRTATARKEADHSSDIVVTLQNGNEVSQVAERKEFTLVTWKNKSGDHYGWVDTAQAFQDQPVAVNNVGDAGPPPDIAGLARPDAGAKPPPPPPVVVRPGPTVDPARRPTAPR
jgi:hypothetical protein